MDRSGIPVRCRCARGWRRSARIGLIVAAALTAPALYGMLFVLTSYDGSIGVISHRQYADVGIGEPRSDVHRALGGPGQESEQFFPPIKRGLTCEYYTTSNAGTYLASLQYRFCFRADLVVSKDLSAAR